MLRTPIVITEHQTYVPSEDFDIYSFLTAHNVELPGIPADYMGTPQCLAIDSTLTASYSHWCHVAGWTGTSCDSSS